MENNSAKNKVIQSLKESERRLRQILKNVNMILVTLNVKGNLTLGYDYFHKIVGRAKKEVLRKNWFDLFIPEESIFPMKNIFESTVKNGEEFTYHEYEIITPNGTRHLIFLNNIILYDTYNNILGFTSIGTGPEYYKNLFQPFHRGKNTKDISGTGLGFSIVKRSFELHGGTITFES